MRSTLSGASRALQHRSKDDQCSCRDRWSVLWLACRMHRLKRPNWPQRACRAPRAPTEQPAKCAERGACKTAGSKLVPNERTPLREARDQEPGDHKENVHTYKATSRLAPQMGPRRPGAPLARAGPRCPAGSHPSAPIDPLAAGCGRNAAAEIKPYKMGPPDSQPAPRQRETPATARNRQQQSLS